MYRLGSVGSIALWEDCACCRCLFALTPEPSSLEQEVILIKSWSIFRLEQGVSIDTKQKRAMSRCVSVILEFVDKKYCGFSKPAELPTQNHHSKFSADALCLVEDDPKRSGTRLRARYVNPTELNVDLVVSWLTECGRRHSQSCQPVWTEELKRICLIDVEERKIVAYPSARCDYIALSYVWGGVNQEVQDAGKFGTSLSLPLPQTIEDAMSLTKALGKQYLWVDSICIDQVHWDHKVEQIGLMSNIYEGAYMTIIAMSGTSANAGLARVGPTSTVHHQVQFTTKSGTVLGIGPTLSYLIAQLPWAKRAWTFQEAILSPRCLYITEFQAYFECNSIQCCESLDNSQLSSYQETQEAKDKYGQVFTKTGDGELRNPFFSGQDTNQRERLLRYCTLVEQYKQRALSFESDAMNAFAGILQASERAYFPDGFILGLPRIAMHCALLWEKVDADVGQENRDFPSWTWLSWTGSVRMKFVDEIDHFGQHKSGDYQG